MADAAVQPAPQRGRRPAGAGGREQILQAAREVFGEHGYQATTVRRVAEVAGVDAKLVHYYFGTKEQLFAETIAAVFRSLELFGLLGVQSAAAPQSRGASYLRAILTELEQNDVGTAFIGLVRNLGTHEESRRLFLRFVGEEIIAKLTPLLPGPDAAVRVALAGSQLLGLLMARYVVQVPPLALLPIDELAALVGPTLDRYLFEESLGPGPADGAPAAA